MSLVKVKIQKQGACWGHKNNVKVAQTLSSLAEMKPMSQKKCQGHEVKCQGYKNIVKVTLI